MTVRFFLNIIFSLIVQEVLSQNLNSYQFITINDQNGLPSSEVYDIVEDQDGFIWFATDRGVSRFNGVTHEIYNSRNGLKGDAAYHLFLQRDTSIVCVNNIGILYRIKNGSIEELIPEDSIKKYVGKTEYPFSFRQNIDGSIHVGTRINLYHFDRTGKILSREYRLSQNTLNIFSNSKNEDLLCAFHRKKINEEFVKVDSLHVVLNNNKIESLKVSNSYNHRSFYPSEFDGNIVIPLENSFILVENDGKRYSVKVGERILAAHIDLSKIFICTENGLFIYSYKKGGLELQCHLLEGVSVSSAFQSKVGKVWISTIENGVRCYDLFRPQLMDLGYEYLNFSTFAYSKGQLITGSYRGYATTKHESFQNNDKRKIYSINFLENDFFILDGLVYDSPYSFRHNEPIKSNSGKTLIGWEIYELNDRVWLTQTSYQLTLFDHTDQTTLDTLVFVKGISSMEVLGEEVYLVSGDQLIIYSCSKGSIHKTGKCKIDETAKLFKYKNKLCGVTQGYRLFRLKSDLSLEWIQLPKPIDFSIVTTVEASEDMIHIGTNRGVYNWKINQSWSALSLQGFENVPNPISIKIIQDSLFFATKKYVYRKALNDIHPYLPMLKMHRILIDGAELQNQKTLQLAHNHQSIVIPIVFTNYSSNPIRFRYRILELSTEYIYTSDPMVRINSLPPGEYTIELSASVDEVNFTTAQMVLLNVGSPFWVTWPFILIVTTLSLFVIYLTYRFRIKKLEAKHKAKEAITQLRSQALGSQLNPHMIFNVLNSIQGLVSEGELEEANIYIARFSKFIRKSLHYMEVSRIPLKDEITITKEYISIEKLRFGDELSITLDEKISTPNDLLVPPLIIQPIIENAIKHGLMPSQNLEKIIEIKFQPKLDYVEIIIQDNGVGFSEGSTFGTGMKVTLDRLKLFHEKNSIEVSRDNDKTTVKLNIHHDS